MTSSTTTTVTTKIAAAWLLLLSSAGAVRVVDLDSESAKDAGNLRDLVFKSRIRYVSVLFAVWVL